jgi:hypothetical protein
MIAWFRQLLIRTGILTPHHATEATLHSIAERSLPQALKRLCSDTISMSVAELRGYVQARAHGVVRLQVRQVAIERGLPAESLDALVMPALMRTTQLIVRQSKAQPVVAVPKAHVRLRIAG